MSDKEKKLIAKVASWVSDNVGIDYEDINGVPLIFGLDTPEQELLEQYLGFERALFNYENKKGE